MLMHYVEYLYLYPGTINHCSIVKEVQNRNPKEINVSEDCMGFRFFDRDLSVDSDKTMQNISGWYYCNCEKLTFEDIKKIFSDEGQQEAIKNYINHKGTGYFVKTKSRHYIPLRKEDTVL